MENKINIAELLKDCPQGMELDCTMYEDCKLLDIDKNPNNYVIRIATPCGVKYLDKYGCYTADYKAKCVIFPKGKTTWEGFVPPCKFKDGDILITANGNPFILKEIDNNKIVESYCGIRQNGEFVIGSSHWTSNYNLQLATKEEKQKLFQAIKENGYRWNAKTKTLEKLIEPKFKVGDKVQHKGATSCGTVYVIESMELANNQIGYVIRPLYDYNHTGLVTVTEEDLQPYKEEIMEEQKKDYEELAPTDYLEFENNDNTWADEVEINLGKDYEIQIRGDKTFIVKKKPQYPKTYEECCNILKTPIDNFISKGAGYKAGLLSTFQKLLICRDAYWKIAGDWKYDVNKTENYFYIVNKSGCIVKEHYMNFNHTLAFPTEEMRDAFYENFKDLIEECKTFL